MKRSFLSMTSLWSVLFFLTASYIYVYSLMEWVFFVTKPSFMSGMSNWLQIKIYLLSALGLSVFPLLIIIFLSVLDSISSNRNFRRVLGIIGTLIPSLTISSLVLLLVDNFTYTVFKYGIVSTERISRATYGFLFVLLVVFVSYRIDKYIQARSKKKHPVKWKQKIALSVFFVFSIFLSLSSLIMNPDTPTSGVETSKNDDLPNIILLGSDGLDATHLSAYGYERETTPYIDSLSPDALVAENAFVNGGTTAGSVASILTGKLPTETRVIYPPDILSGEDSYQHLPGILNRLGYHTVDLSVSYFGDAITLNMQGGFDIANQRSGTANLAVRITRILGGGDSAYFTDMMIQRISDRLRHIFFVKQMINPYEVVIKPASREDEQKRFNDLISTLEGSDTPVFVHVHMLGTHGPKFEIREQVFSAGQKQNADWMMDFYDDAILSFDQYVGELFSYLKDSGKSKDTIVIVYSDHGMKWTISQRVPLLMWFPQGSHAGIVRGNVENIDIAPTILDYLGISIPNWMEGQSLLKRDRVVPVYIFSASVDASLIEVTKEGLWVVDTKRKSPPFYQIGYVGLVACDQWFELYLQNPAMIYGNVKGHAHHCEQDYPLTPGDAKNILLAHLLKNGFDTSSFPSSIPVNYRGE